MLVLDADKGSLEVLVDDFAEREVATADLTAGQQGMGRELFEVFRRVAGPAATGGNTLLSD